MRPDLRVNALSGTTRITAKTHTPKVTASVAGTEMGQRDSFTISGTAGDFMMLRRVLAGTSDVRQDLVDTVRERMDSGSYTVSASDVAEKILRSF